MAILNEEKLRILTNIIGAVESGGQIYGNRDYSAYAKPYANSNTEHTCTIGWAQNYGNEARRLCRMIFNKDAKSFINADTSNIEDMLEIDWESTRWSPNDEQVDALINIITTDCGKECQDILFEYLMIEYCESALKFDENMSCHAQMMWCEIEHLGGYVAAKRIFSRAKKPYTTQTIFDSLILDQDDDSNSNQVGDKKFQKRHECCVSWIRKYLSDDSIEEKEEVEMTVKEKIELATKWMEDTANDNSHGYDQIYRWGEKGDYDCSSAVITAWQTAGVPVKDCGATYTGNMYNVFKKNGFTDITSSVNMVTGAGLQRGDVLLNTTHHVAMYCGNGMEVEASINEKGGATKGTPGDQTGKEFLIRTYRYYPWNKILRYTNGEEAKVVYDILSKGCKGEDVKKLQENLNKILNIGLKVDGDFGTNTYNAVIAFQKAYGLIADGEVGKQTSAKIETVIKNIDFASISIVKTDIQAKSFSKDIAGTYITTAELNLRKSAGTSGTLMTTMNKGKEVQNYGYYTDLNGKKWYYVKYAVNETQYIGFCSSAYLKKK